MMPPESDNKMEELLKAYADKRRNDAGAPFEMHPATRAMLQAEIARRYPQGSGSEASAGKASGTRFFCFSRLLLYGSGLAAVVVCAALLLKERSLLVSFPSAKKAVMVASVKMMAPGMPEAVPPPPINGIASVAAPQTISSDGDLPPQTLTGNLQAATGSLEKLSLDNAREVTADAANKPTGTILRGNDYTITDAPHAVLATSSGNSQAGIAITGSSTAFGGTLAMNGNEITDRDMVRNETEGRNGGDTRSFQYKLDHIIIPKIEFRDVTVREAVNFLQDKTRQIEADEPDSTWRNFKIELAPAPADLAAATSSIDTSAISPAVPGLQPQNPGARSGAPAAPTAQVTAPADARITLSLKNIPLGEALRYITNLAGMKVRLANNTVTLAPLSEPTDTLITKEYNVPPDFLATMARATKSDSLKALALKKSDVKTPVNGDSPHAPVTAKNLLEKAGVPFMPGASAAYVPGNHKLVVRNTEANLDLVDQYVDSLASTGKGAGQQPTATSSPPITSGGTAVSGGTLAFQNGATKTTLVTDGTVRLAENISLASGAGVLPQQNTPGAATPVAAPAAGAAAETSVTDWLVGNKTVTITGPSDQASLEKKKSSMKPDVEPASILSIFELQLDGNHIRLIDSDGSVYAGTIDLPGLQQEVHLVISKGQMFSNQAALSKYSLAQTRQTAERKQAPMLPSVVAGASNSVVTAGISNGQAMDTQKEAQKPQQSYSFHASGNSRSLDRMIVVEGTYVVEAPQRQIQKQIQSQLQKGTAVPEKQQQPVSQDEFAKDLEPQNVRIQAEAQINNGAKIEIDAVAIPLKAKAQQ